MSRAVQIRAAQIRAAQISLTLLLLGCAAESGLDIELVPDPNINTVETYDTTVPMLLRPPSMGDDRLMFPEDEAWYQE